MIAAPLAQPAAGSDIWHQIFNFADYPQLLALVHNSILAGAILGVVGGLISTFVMMRDLPFAVHGTSELSFAGAAGALLLGVNVVMGSLIGSILAAVVIGALGSRARDRNSIIGVLMPFGLGLGVLFLALYKGRAANKFGLLTGQIVAVDTPTAVDLSSGEPSDPAVRADLTVTFHRPKTGLSTRRGAAHAGKVLVAPIGIPPEADRG